MLADQTIIVDIVPISAGPTLRPMKSAEVANAQIAAMRLLLKFEIENMVWVPFWCLAVPRGHPSGDARYIAHAVPV